MTATLLPNRSRAGRSAEPHLRLCTGSWRVDETYIKVKGIWTYLYSAVDSLGQTIDFRLSTRRDADAAGASSARP